MVEHNPGRIVVALRTPVCTIAAAVLGDVDWKIGLECVLDVVEQLSQAPWSHIEPARFCSGNTFVLKRVRQRDLVVKHPGFACVGRVAGGIDQVRAIVVETDGGECGPTSLEKGFLALGENWQILHLGRPAFHRFGVVVNKPSTSIRDAVDGMHEPPEPTVDQSECQGLALWVRLVDRVLIVAVVDDAEVEGVLLARLAGKCVCDDHVVRCNIGPNIHVQVRCSRRSLPPPARQLACHPSLVEGRPILHIRKSLEAEVGIIHELLDDNRIYPTWNWRTGLRCCGAIPTLVVTWCLVMEFQLAQMLHRAGGA
mmetsp:Transcript_70101/g.193928  ORF Transcript_70101/g.193928 Transcript_70101/m.193928 type:complete len:311 (+) Transcript_70101:544-1476(+)